MRKLYPYQKQVFDYLLQGRNVIIQAPTGAGKTWAALFPYFQMLDRYNGRPESPLPPTCRYAVPIRVLATQFEREYHEYFDKLDRTRGTNFIRNYRNKLGLKVPAIQTGETPDDPQFESPLTFCTIDQLLASFIGTPYSISPRMANLNVGAFAGSYLILDEFHLYPLAGTYQGARTTALAMLQLLNCTGTTIFSPFVMMTATFSTHLLKELARLLNAEIVSLIDLETSKPNEDELREIMQERSRAIRCAEDVMSPERILAEHEAARAREAGASLVVCNTVGRAQDIYVRLRDLLHQQGKDTQFNLCLLHSRFTPADRQRKSADLEAWLGKEQWRDGTFLGKDTIVIGTQVVEVGLNISAGILHTELAPANSLIQRAGRCARFAKQQGEVVVYPIPSRDDSGTISYKPYDEARCQATWEHLGEMIARDGGDRMLFGFLQEQALIDVVHTDEDRAMLEAYSKNAMQIQNTIMEVLASHECGREGELIRNVEQVSLVIHSTPEKDITQHPFAWEAFGLHPGTLAGAYEALDRRRAELGPDGPDWTMRELVPAGDAASDDLGADADNDRAPHYTWDCLTIADPKKAYNRIRGALRVALPPELATYDEELGFRLLLDPQAPTPAEEKRWQSQKREVQGKQRSEIGGKQSSYVEHISGLMRAYRFSVQGEFGWLVQRLARALNLPSDKMDLALRLAIACHDIGKLSVGWQRWAHDWQNLLVRERGAGYQVQPGREWLAKTDRLEWWAEIELRKKIKTSRPHHSCESAVASTTFLGAHIADGLTDAQKAGGLALTRAAISAIARHHAPTASSHEAVAWDAAALSAINDALCACELEHANERRIDLRSRGAGAVNANYLLSANSESQAGILATWLGFALVRALRLCDQRAERDL